MDGISQDGVKETGDSETDGGGAGDVICIIVVRCCSGVLPQQHIYYDYSTVPLCLNMRRFF